MKKDGIGGSNTKTGLVFEGKTDLKTFFENQTGYSCRENGDGFVEVFFQNISVAYIFKKHELYKMLEKRGVDWEKVLSSKLLPDDSIYVIVKNTLFIIECKFQSVQGSVDEKLQTCDFKKKQYKKLLSQINIDVEYIYILSDWFKQDKYKDVLDYIISVGCGYYFNYIPLVKFGLPVDSE